MSLRCQRQRVVAFVATTLWLRWSFGLFSIMTLELLSVGVEQWYCSEVVLSRYMDLM